ncbi:MAG TPA: tetratricopeptide repeat protein [Ktedonobacterales bacterium]|jgi:tetratricopeptide (TPR) repeat protein|nr:tetratricopeptide repeat protein [Ktedonobacterales bacterium]
MKDDPASEARHLNLRLEEATPGAHGERAASHMDARNDLSVGGLRVSTRALLWPDAQAPRQARRGHRALFALIVMMLCVMLAPIQPADSAYLLAATQARADYRYDMALADYAQAHTADSADPRPLCAAGDVYTLQKLPSQAAASYRACANAAPINGSAWLRLGDALASANDVAGAVIAWRQAGEARDYTGYARLAEHAEGLGQLDEAARWWSQVPQDDELAQGHLGLLDLAQGNVSGAGAHFFALRHSQSAYAIQLRNAGVFLFAGHVPTSALDEENIGYALLTLGEPAVALAPLRRATQLAPTDGSARAYYGWTLWQLGRLADARPQIAAGLRYSSTLPFALYAAGQVSMADGKFARALALFQTALEITPKNPALWSAAGDAALAEADYVTAELSYGNAARFSDDQAYSVALVQFYLDHGIGMDHGQAQQSLYAAMRRFPKSEPLAFLEGRIYDSLGQTTLAFYAFEHALALDPTDPGPWLYLGRYAAESGDVAPAIVSLRTALALQPTGAFASQSRQALASLSAYSL